MKMIPVFEDHPIPYLTGEDVSRILDNYRNVKGNFYKQSVDAFQRFGTARPANRCGRCTLADCFSLNLFINTGDAPTVINGERE